MAHCAYVHADAAAPPKPQPQRPLVVALAKAFKWQKMMESGEVGSIKELARRNHINPSYIARILRLATLAPDIVEAILDGREPSGPVSGTASAPSAT